MHEADGRFFAEVKAEGVPFGKNGRCIIQMVLGVAARLSSDLDVGNCEMALMLWAASQFSADLGFADKQHQVLCDKLNHVHDLAMRNSTLLSMNSALGDLIVYADGHFDLEEKAMQAIKYPGCEARKDEHKVFLETCQYLQTKLQAGEAEVSQMAERWLRQYIPTFVKASF